MVSLELSISKGWLAHVLPVRFDRDYYFDPQVRHAVDQRCHACVEEAFSGLNAFHTESNLGRKAFFDAGQVLVGGIQPNLIQGMLLGAEFLPRPDKDADISQACWAGRDVADLPAPAAILDHELVRLFDEQIREIRRSAGNGLTPIPPFFWDASGRAAVHGPLTTAQKFLGQQVFVDLLDDPARALAMMDWVTETNILLVRHFSEQAGITLSGLHVGECAACMIDADLFNRFVVPCINRMGEALGPVRFHSCGSSDHLMAACLQQLPSLYELDVGGETSLRKIRQCFGQSFPVSMAPMVKDLTAQNTQGLVEWLHRVLADNQGGPLNLLCHLEPNYNQAALKCMHDALL